MKNNIKSVENKLDKLSRVISSDLDALLNGVAGVLESSTRKRFDEERDPEGKKWAALNPRYKQRKLENSWSGNILNRSGALRDSILGQVTRNIIQVGTNVTSNGYPYAAAHQFGTDTTEQRAFLGVSNDDITNIEHLIEKFLSEAVE